MPSREPIGWMWAEACEVLEQAERLRRQFFRLDFPRGARVTWEPPVDVFEDESELIVVVALPGVTPANAQAVIDDGTLVIRARRDVPLEDRRCSIERLEIPHGYFERRLALRAKTVRLESERWADGCLLLTVRKMT